MSVDHRQCKQGMDPPDTHTITALLGPTNTGKTHQAIERMLEHDSGMIGLPLRLLAREVYDRISSRLGERAVALVTGEEKRIPPRPRYWVCTVEAMPEALEVDFLAVDEIQLAAHPQRGHVFTARLLHARGRRETWFMGADTMRPLIERLVPTARMRAHPRFSKLSATRTHTIASLPPRSAVVGFTLPRVYALAERLKARRGGAAVVLGALSPRARNAQVALYQSGEVDYMVATDAIGMGLNLDLEHVAFADTRKFDGRRERSLEIPEIAQIAGRAGRHLQNGTFGVLAPQRPFAPQVTQAVERHRFAPERHLVWRNTELQLDSLEALIESLRRIPRRGELRLVESADDYNALLELTQRPEIRERARTRAAVELLWQVCQIPDFRQLLLQVHVNLLGELFVQLYDRGRLDSEWIRARLERLDDPAVDIDMLLARMAAVRIWTYISNRREWVQDAQDWQMRALAIEDRLSDALHEKLVEQFVDRSRRRHHLVADQLDEEALPGPFGALARLKREMFATSEEIKPEASLENLADAPHESFQLDASGSLRAGERELARLRMGGDILYPQLVLTLELAGGIRARLERRLTAWVRDAVQELLEPLQDPAVERSPTLRGVAYQLQQSLGTVPIRQVRQQLDALDAGERAQLSALGVHEGVQHLYLKPALSKYARTRRAALASAYFGFEASLLAGSRVTVPANPDVKPDAYLAVGFAVVQGRAVRVDQLEKLQRAMHGRELPSPQVLGSWLGCPAAEASRIAAAVSPHRKQRARRRRSRQGPRRRSSTPSTADSGKDA